MSIRPRIIERRLRLVLVGTTVLAAGVASVSIVLNEYGAGTSEEIERIREGMIVDAGMMPLGLERRPAEIQRHLESLFRREGIVAAGYYDSRRLRMGWSSAEPSVVLPEELAEGASAIALDGNMVWATESVLSGNATEGYLVAVYRLPSLFHRLGQHVTIMLGIGLGLVLLLLVLVRNLRKLVFGPLEELAATADAVSQRHDFTLRASIVTDDEVGRLGRSFNEMLGAIDRREQEQHSRSQRLARQKEGLAEMTRIEQRCGPDIRAASRAFAELLVDVQDVWRVSVWLYSPDRAQLVCVDLYDVVSKTHEHGDTIVVADFPTYFGSLERERVVDIPDCSVDDRTLELHRGKAGSLAHGSMMDVPIRWRGAVVGVLCHQCQRKPRVWYPDEISFAIFAADHVALVLEASEAMRATTAQKESEERYRSLFNEARDAIFTLSRSGRILELNRAVEDMTGWDPLHWLGQQLEDVLLSEDRSKLAATLERVAEDGHVPPFEIRVPARSGELLDLEVAISSRLREGEVIGFLCVARNVSERKRAAAEQEKLEAQLRQAQKMESLGTLAGGIAHDFNNMLTGIMGNAELVNVTLPEDHPAQEFVDGVLKSSARARDLVRQILTFSRRGEHKMAPLRPSQVVNEALELLRPSIPATVEIVARFESALPVILGDPTMLHQVVMNLVTNAVHAIDDAGSGRIEVRLNTVTLDEEQAAAIQPLGPGQYVRLSISDNGSGMDAATLERIFEPFFTTKGAGKGTGLGLPVVHGIVEQHRGAIRVESAVGAGTTFHIYVPVCEAVADLRSHDPVRAKAVSGSGHVLVVDDEEVVARVARGFLEKAGYTVAVRTDAREALREVRAGSLYCELVLVDLTMPHMKGTRFAALLREFRPDLPVLLATGYLGQQASDEVREQGITAVVSKPYTMQGLTEAVALALSESKERRQRRFED